MKILLSGFEPFNKALTNSSELVAREIEKRHFDFELKTCILPVVYSEAFEKLQTIVNDFEPHAILSLGQAEGRTAISLERRAVNKDDVLMPDNSGEIRSNQVIVHDADDELPTTLPIDEIYDALLSAKVPVEYSESAGNFLCNNLFYNSQFRFTSTPSGFIHLPLVDIQIAEFPEKPYVALRDAVRGIEIALKTIASVLRDST